MSRSEKMRAFWANPENRERVKAKMNSPEVRAKRAAVWTPEKRAAHSLILTARTIKTGRQLPHEILPDEEELYRYLMGKGYRRAEAVQIVIDNRKTYSKQLGLFEQEPTHD